MAYKTKPSEITARDRRNVQQFIKDSKAAGYDPTLTTIVLQKAMKSPKTARKISQLQSRKPKKSDDARAKRSAEARRQAKRAGREAKAIRDEGGFLTTDEWLAMARDMLLTVAGGAALAPARVAIKAGGAALKGGQAMLKAAKAKKALKAGKEAKRLKAAPKRLKAPKPKQLPPGRSPKGGDLPPGPSTITIGRPGEMRQFVARQEAARKLNKARGAARSAAKTTTGRRPIPRSGAPAFGQAAAKKMSKEVLSKIAKNPNAKALKGILNKANPKEVQAIHRWVTAPRTHAKISPDAKLTPNAYKFIKEMFK